MPIERQSRGFKDVSLTLKQNPLTKDVVSLKNNVAIARSIRNLILTYPGERFFQPNLGCLVSRLLFENMSPIVADQIKDQIYSTIISHEPRVNLIDQSVNVFPDYENNSYNVSIKYIIVGEELNPQEVSFVLQSAR